MAMIEEKIHHPDAKHEVKNKNKAPSNVNDLVSVLQQSLAATQTKPKASSKASKPQSKRKAA